MALGFRMGGAGSQPQEKRLWIVKDGVIQVTFDNAVYSYSTDYSAVATQWSYSSAYNVLSHSTNMGSAKSCGYATTDKIDASKYSSLTVVYKTLNTASDFSTQKFTVNANTLAYLVLSLVTQANGTTAILDTFLSSAKTNYNTNRIEQFRIAQFTAQSGTQSQIKDIYLEP